MSRYQDRFKKKISRYEEERTFRAIVKQKDRRESRHQNFANRRNIEEDVLKPLKENQDNTNNKRMEKLMLWKQQKQNIAALEKKNKKPPFKCGTVHYKFKAEFPSPVNTSKLNRSRAVNTTNVEKSFAPKCHPFKAPSSVVPIQMVQLGIEKNAKEIGKEEIPQNSSKINFRSTRGTFTKGRIEADLSKDRLGIKASRKITNVVSRKSEVQPRRSARISNKPLPVSEIKTFRKMDTLQVPIALENLATVLECENEDTSPNNQEKKISTKISTPKKVERSSSRIAAVNAVKTPEPLKENLSGKVQEKQEGEDKNKSPPLSMIYPVSLSPFICKKRGSERLRSPVKTPIPIRESGGLRKQIAKKIIVEKLNDPLEIEKEEKKCMLIEENVFVTSPSEDRNITYFRNLHSDEMKRLGSICLDWDALTTSEDISIDIQDSIRSTVCLARLFMREKLAQFKGLVDRCSSSGPATECKVTYSDLQGFWDLVSIQVDDINSKFNKLTELKENNWEEVLKEPLKSKSRLRKVNKEPLKTKNATMDKKSSFQLFLQEKKKKKQKEEMTNEPIAVATTPSQLNSSMRSILRSSKRRKSAKMSPEGHSDGGPFAFDITPRKVTFKEMIREKGSQNKMPVTPHIRKGRSSNRILSNGSPCTPIPNGDLMSFEST